MSAIGIGLLGLGNVGSEVAAHLDGQGPRIAARAGARVELRRVLVRSLDRRRDRPLDAARMTLDADDVLLDPQVRIVIELIGGIEPARSYIERALVSGRSVVTANKEVMARDGPRLLELARRHHVDLRFEAAVGGAIPVVGALRVQLAANDVRRVEAVINGTTNVILERMTGAGATLEEALGEARRLGYAEADATQDVDGHDAVSKLTVLAAIALRRRIHPDEVHRTGIRGVQAIDLRCARELGHAVKLLAVAEVHDDGVEAWVHPCCIPLGHPLAGVDGVENGVRLDCDLAGGVVLRGPGAGGPATASAVLGDVIGVVVGPGGGGVEPAPPRAPVRPMAPTVGGAYLRCRVTDVAGARSGAQRVLEEAGTGIVSALDLPAPAGEDAPFLVLVTGPARDDVLVAVRERIARLEAVRSVASSLRVLHASG